MYYFKLNWVNCNLYVGRITTRKIRCKKTLKEHIEFEVVIRKGFVMEKVDEIIEFFRTQVNDDNIDEVISIIKKRLSGGSKEYGIIRLDYGDGSFSEIPAGFGANRLGTSRFGGKKSAIDIFISDDITVNVQDGMMDIVNLTVDECKEAYESLIRKIQSLERTSFEDIMMAVYSVVDEYFGGVDKVDPKEREEYYNYLGVKDQNAKLSDFKGENLAACVERAALSHNLLKLLGFNAVCKSSQITINGSIEVHNYNLVEYKGKYYLFDATIPNKDERGNVSPIIAEIPKEVFEKLSHQMHEDDVAILVDHDTVRGHKKICYNSWSEKVFDARSAMDVPNGDDGEVDR